MSMPPYEPPAPTAPRKPRTWLVVLVAVIALLCCLGGAVTVLGGGSDAPASAPLIAVEPSVAPAAPSAAPFVKIAGDGLVHVGSDAPAGTYRAVSDVDGLCYWLKSRDAEGSQIIDNGLPTGGRPQVTLKRGQWFTSQGCPDWRKQ